MKKMFIILFVISFLFSYEIVTKYSTNLIYTWQLQGEINDSGDIDENLVYVNWYSPSNYYFFFADGVITGGEDDDLWKWITNHVSTNE